MLEVPTTSHQSRPPRPIQSVQLKISISASRRAAEKLREAYPGARVRREVFELTISGQDPAKVALDARALLENLRRATKNAKEFK